VFPFCRTWPRDATRDYAPGVRGLLRSVLLLAVVLACLPGHAAAPPGSAPPARTADVGEMERQALGALDRERWVRARELATRILRADPDSPVGEYVLAVALHEGEGNVALALHHYRRARKLLEDREGEPLPGREKLHRELLRDLARCLGTLGRYGEQLAVLRELRERYEPDTWYLDVWPLMKLGRLDEARAAAARAIATGRVYDELVARNGLCAIDGWPACRELLARVRELGLPLDLPLRNAASSAVEVGRYEDAERWFLEAAEMGNAETNPWQDLVELYVLEGRLPEAVDAAKRMLRRARRFPPLLRQAHRSGALAAAAELFLAGGDADRAVEAVERALAEPDRTSHWSGAGNSVNSALFLLGAAAHRARASRCAEVRAVSGWKAAPGLLVAAIRDRLRASWLARRALPILERGGLRPQRTARERLRPFLSGPSWLLPDGVALLGAGPTLALVRELETAPPEPRDPAPPELRRAWLAVLETEALALAGRPQECRAAARRALADLPRAERLLRARVHLRAGQAALAAGDREEAARHFSVALGDDPALFRRLDVPLPVAPPAGPATGVAAAALARALASPRLAREPRSPFRLVVSGGRPCLLGAGGRVIACGRPPRKAQEGEEKSPRASRPRERPLPCTPPSDDPVAELAVAFLDAVFSPRASWLQSGLGSLDGSTVSGRGLDEAFGELDLDLPGAMVPADRPSLHGPAGDGNRPPGGSSPDPAPAGSRAPGSSGPPGTAGPPTGHRRGRGR